MLNQRPKFCFTLLLMLVFVAPAHHSVHAQFNGRPYQQWTAQEADAVIIESPWAQTQMGLLARRFENPTDQVDAATIVRLQSSAPVRQALARLGQLKNKYDQKSAAERKAIDDQYKSLLECRDCADSYIVVMSLYPGSKGTLPQFLRHASFDQIKQNVQIKNENGETRPLTNFISPAGYDGEAIFYFARFDANGAPLIAPANQKVIVSFDPRVFDWKKPTLTKFEFDVSKMTVNGKVLF